MSLFIRLIRQIRKMTSGHSYAQALLFLVILVVAGAFLMFYFEKDINEQFTTIGDSLWWAVTTITTVGYGDRYPLTTQGRIVAAVVMFGGIGSFGFIAGSLLDDIVQRGKGRMKIRFQNHFVICSYNFKVENIVKEIISEVPDCKIVLIADREENPVLHDGVHFIRGDSTREAVLELANVAKAKTVIILAEQTMQDEYTDAHSVLTTLAVKHLNPSCRVVAESLDPENSYHLTRAGADEIVCISDITAKLISRSSLHIGMTHLMSELMTNNSGSELYSAATPDELIGQTFDEAFHLFKIRGAILLGIYQNGTLVPNPPAHMLCSRESILVYISQDRIF